MVSCSNQIFEVIDLAKIYEDSSSAIAVSGVFGDHVPGFCIIGSR
jgi:hypothetical protein